MYMYKYIYIDVHKHTNQKIVTHDDEDVHTDIFVWQI